MQELFKRRLTVALVLFYAAGIFLGVKTKFNFWLTGSVLTVLLIVAIVVLRKNKAFLKSIMLCILILAIGVIYVGYSAENRQSTLRGFVGEKCRVYGTVITSPSITEKGNHYFVNVDVHKIEQKGKTTPANGRVIVYVKRTDNTAPKMNDCIYFYTKLENPDFKEGSFDYNEYLRTKDIYAMGFTNEIYPYTGYDKPNSVTYKIKALGREINMFLRDRIDEVFSYDQDASALMKGILLGEKTDFTEEMESNLSLAGVSHIAAVSGLHLNILFGALCGFLGFMRVHRKFAAGITLPAILLFAAVTGFTPSVCRAAIMLALCLLALLFKKQYDSLTALFVSAFIILTVNPYALFGISFILSFSSTLSIILLYKRINSIFKGLSEKSIILKGILASISLSAAAFIGTAPFIAYYFGVVTFASFIANILIIPLCTPIFIFGYLLCGISLFLPELICNILLCPLAFWIEMLINITDFFANLKFAYIKIGNFSAIYLLIYFVVVTLFAIPKKQPQE